MKSNLGTIDKVIRILIAVAALILFLTHTISGTFGVIILAVGAVLALTTVVSFCPLYYLFGLTTKTKEKSN